MTLFTVKRCFSVPYARRAASWGVLCATSEQNLTANKVHCTIRRVNQASLHGPRHRLSFSSRGIFVNTAQSAEARDIAHVLHGYTNLMTHQLQGPMVIEGGDGIYVIDNKGRRYLEAMSGLWCAGLGFSESRLIDAAVRQMRKLPYYHHFSHKSHNPMIDLAETLIRMAPVPMTKAYFASSGSEANDSAIKMLWYRSNALGQTQRKKIISRMRAYHGVTVASASLTGLANNHRSFDLPLPGFHHVGSPHHWRDALSGESEEQFASRLARELEELILREGAHTIAAFFGEPVMGAGGVVVPPRTYWAKIQEVLRRYDILLVADEVICGFGRTGNMFACQTFDIRPDIIVVSKQLTSAYVPMSALLVNQRVFEPLAAQSGAIGVFGHGFTAGGHPLAAAVAIETLKIIEERNLVAHAAGVGSYMQQRLRSLAHHPLVGEVRGIGLIAGVELVIDKAAKRACPQPGQLGALVSGLLTEEGCISRNMVDTLAFCPPLITTTQQIDEMVGMLERALDRAARQVL
jgi:4-aminobutyrate---pyruvate transaminase